jgi:iron(III) transport system substrate-binding protein
MTKRTRWYRVAVVAAALAVASTGCSGSAGTGSEAPPAGEPLVIDGEQIADADLLAAANDEGSFVIYTSATEQRARAVLDAFRDAVGIDYELVRLAGGALSQRITGEHAAGQLGADVVQQSDYSLAIAAKDEGVFAPYCPPAKDSLPQGSTDAQCTFWPAQDGVHVIIYNTEMVSEQDSPKSWDDLLDPKWAGKFNMPYIGTGGSTWARELMLRKDKGVEFWEKLAAQKPVLTASSSTTLEAVVRGESPIGNAVTGAALEAIGQGAPIAMNFPTDGAPAYSTWTGLTSSAAHPAAAKVFLNWLASKAGQTVVAEEGGDYAVRADVPPPRANGKPLPTRQEAGLVYPEQWPEYLSERKPYQDEWLKIFNYQG